MENIANFQAYGFLPELMARFTRIVPFQSLGAPTLREILRVNVIERDRAVNIAASGARRATDLPRALALCNAAITSRDAVVIEDTATTVVPPGYAVSVDDIGSLVIRRKDNL